MRVMRKLPVVPICRRLAKACGPGTLGLVLSLRKTIPRATVTIRSRTPGRARTTPLTPSRREGRVSRLNLWLLTRVLSTLHTRLRVQPAPGFACALFSRDKVDARLGRVSAARMMTFVYPLFEMFIGVARVHPTRRSRMPQRPFGRRRKEKAARNMPSGRRDQIDQ
jgi:hypothetical protein